MELLNKIQRDLSDGISALRKEGSVLLMKTMAEIDILKSRLDIYKVHGRLSELYRDLGERFIAAAEKGDHEILSRDEVKAIIEDIETIRIEEERHRKELENLRGLQRDYEGD